MKIKKKIAVWCMMCALLVTLVPSSSARAEESMTEEERIVLDGMSLLGDRSGFVYREEVDGVPTGYVLMVPWDMFYYSKYNSAGPFRYECLSGDTFYVETYQYILAKEEPSWEYAGYTEGPYTVDVGYYNLFNSAPSGISHVFLASNMDIYDAPFSEEVYYEANYSAPHYTFKEWCAEAGIECAASSNESSDVIPFWYADEFYYYYVVSKTLTASSTSGVYRLTMVQVPSGNHSICFKEVNGVKYLQLDGETEAPFTYRNFVYDEAGNGWKLVEKKDISELPYTDINTSFYDDVVCVFSNTDICDEDYSEILYARSETYYNVEVETPQITTVPEDEIGSSNEEIEGLDGLISTMEDLVSLVSVVPQMIGAVFGFLPDWCLAVIGVGFAFAGVFLVVKLIRG